MRTLIFTLLLATCGPGRPNLPPNACSPAAADDDRRPWELGTYGMTVPWFAPRRGAERPRVVVQLFSDFECPFCAGARPLVERIVADYGACVSVVWRHRPLHYHRHAERAARASTEVYQQAGDEAFWRYHDALFEDQEHLERDDLVAQARALGGIDIEAFEAAIDGDTHREVVARDRAAITRTELRVGTPTFFINGRVVHGARPYPQFQRIIEEQLLAALSSPEVSAPSARETEPAAAEIEAEPQAQPETEPAEVPESGADDAEAEASDAPAPADDAADHDAGGQAEPSDAADDDAG